MEGEELCEVQKKVKDLCVFLHTELVNLVPARQRDPADEDSFMELGEVLALDTLSALDQIEAAVKELISAKRQLLNTSHYSMIEEQDKYCHALQKLESEARSHIQAEHQMALHIEVLQQKLEDEAKEKDKLVESYDQLLEKMQKDYDAVCGKLRESEGRMEGLPTAIVQKSSTRKIKTIQDLNLRKLPVTQETNLPVKSKDMEYRAKKSPDSDSHGKTSDLTRLRRDLEEALKETRLVRPKDSLLKSSSRSISPLLATLRRDTDRQRNLSNKGLKKHCKGKGRSASSDKLRGAKSNSALALQQLM